MGNRVSVYRREHFNAAHRLFNPAWTEVKNAAVFGKCNNHNYHGHNYDLEVKVTGVIDPETGYVMDMKLLSDLINEHVLEVLDHRNLNLDIPYFKTVNPTAENICVFIYDIIRKKIDSKFDVKIRLYETERNYVDYPG